MLRPFSSLGLFRGGLVWALAFSLGLSACGDDPHLRVTLDGGEDSGPPRDAGPGRELDASEDAGPASCAVDNGGCGDFALCDDSSGEVVCAPCPGGFVSCGGDCVDPSTFDDAQNCGGCGVVCDEAAGACVGSGSGFACVCDENYVGDGLSCEFDPCEAGPTVCAGTGYDYLCVSPAAPAPESSLYICRGLFPEWPVGDAELRASGRFEVQEGEALVYDNLTGLTWQRALTDGSAGLSWAGAKAHCESLTLAGGGFRLPEQTELESLIDDSRTISPLIDVAAFPGTPSASNTFWSASPYLVGVGEAASAWRVNFAVGSSGGTPILDLRRVRCVR